MTVSAYGRGTRSATSRNQLDPHAYSPLAPEVPWSCSTSPSGYPLWAGSERLRPQLQGQGWWGGLLKTLEVSATLPAPCLVVVVNRRGVRSLQAGWGSRPAVVCAHASPWFCIWAPCAHPSCCWNQYQGINQGIPEETRCSRRNKQTFSFCMSQKAADTSWHCLN